MNFHKLTVTSKFSNYGLFRTSSKDRGLVAGTYTGSEVKRLELAHMTCVRATPLQPGPPVHSGPRVLMDRGTRPAPKLNPVRNPS